jgi:hypothetical protein
MRIRFLTISFIVVAVSMALGFSLGFGEGRRNVANACIEQGAFSLREREFQCRDMRSSQPVRQRV